MAEAPFVTTFSSEEVRFTAPVPFADEEKISLPLRSKIAIRNLSSGKSFKTESESSLKSSAATAKPKNSDPSYTDLVMLTISLRVAPTAWTSPDTVTSELPAPFQWSRPLCEIPKFGSPRSLNRGEKATPLPSASSKWMFRISGALRLSSSKCLESFSC